MSDETSKELSEPGRAAREAEARRDARIEQLERTLADEREHAANLRSQVNELRFQMEILDKSYSKQLQDARARADAAEKRADGQQVRVAELDGARKDAIDLLTEANAEIERLSKQRQSRSQSNTPGNAEAAPRSAWPANVVVDDLPFDESTINTLLDDAKWVRDKAPDEEARLKAEAEARASETEHEDMISPDLVFTAKAADNER
jgi:hypothetical protein